MKLESITIFFRCTDKIKLAGDSIWNCPVKSVTLRSIQVVEHFKEGKPYGKSISVEHDGGGVEGNWRIYSDSGFPKAISQLLGYEVHFTEQGMQADGLASME